MFWGGVSDVRGGLSGCVAVVFCCVIVSSCF
jgi:hypothetical protein